MKKKVAVIYGGYSSESDISKKSANTIFDNLDREFIEPFLVEISKTNWQVHVDGKMLTIDKNDFSFSIDNQSQSFDIAYNTIHGTPGEDGKLLAYLDMIGLAYVNSSSFSSSLSFNKWACNVFLSGFGIATAKSILLKKSDIYDIGNIAQELGFPCFVKPNDGGSSYGISKVKRIQDIPGAIEQAFSEGDEVIIEAFLEGREFTCGIYKLDGEIITLPPTEIISENDFFDHEAKYLGKSNEVTPANLSDKETANMQEITTLAYSKLGLSGIARIDFMLNPNGTFYVIEVNTTPGMTTESIIPQQMKTAGKDLKDVLTSLVKEKLSA